MTKTSEKTEIKCPDCKTKMYCPHCTGSEGGKKSKRKITSAQQAKMQQGRNIQRGNLKMTKERGGEDKCPQCKSGTGLKYPRDNNVYCKDCGWPDEDFAPEDLREKYKGGRG